MAYGRQSVGENSGSGEEVERYHVFVDRDVTVSLAQDWTETWTDYEAGFPQTITNTIRAFTITLRQGWNAIHIRGTGDFTFEEGILGNFNFTTTISTADPGRQLRWVLYEFDDWDDYSETLDRSRGALPNRPTASPFRARR